MQRLTCIEIVVELEDWGMVVTVICENYDEIVQLEQLSALSGYTLRQAASLATMLGCPTSKFLPTALSLWPLIENMMIAQS